MAFLRMALRNVVRNWNRTGMNILGMLVASSLMTVTVALSSGYAQGAALSYRQMVGADILVYPNRFVFGGPDDPGDSWQWRLLGADQPTDALFFHPALRRGHLSPSEAPAAYFDADALPAELKAIEGVAEIVPARLMNAFLVAEDVGDGSPVRIPVTLRGRDLALDTTYWDIPAVVTIGRYFRPDQDGEWLAILNQQAFEMGPYPGERLVLDVPAVKGRMADGSPILDLADLKTFYFMVYGSYLLSLGQVRIENAVELQAADQGPVGPPPTWQVAIDEPEVWVPAATFDRIYEQVSGQPFRYTRQLCIAVDNMFLAKDISAALSEVLPDATVLTVPQEVALAGIRYRARLQSWDPFRVEVVRQYSSRPTLAVDLKSELSALAFVVAGLLIVANMYILVTQRRREIGVLKAVGAADRDILTLIVTEVVGYSLAGSLLGFLTVRLLTIASMFASHESMVEGALLTVKAAGMVIGLTVGTALVFGLLPALEAARTPSASLLRDS